jgi:hypothetical protein
MKDFMDAFKIGGMKLVFVLIFYTVVSKILGLDIFNKLSSGDTFIVIYSIILLPILWYIVDLIASKIIQKSDEKQIFKLQEAWIGLREINCDNIVVPSLISAINTLQLTSVAWNERLVSKKNNLPNVLQKVFNTI